MSNFSIQITDISATSWIIKPDMIEVLIPNFALEKAQRIINSMIENGVDESTIRSAIPPHSFTLYQSIDHLEKEDIIDKLMKVGNDGKKYVSRDLNYHVPHADFKIERAGEIVLEFPIDKTVNRLTCPIGTINSLRNLYPKSTST